MIYPNPNDGSFTVHFTLGNDETTTLELYDISGRRISVYQMQPGSSTTTIIDPALENGIYLYRVMRGSSEIGNGRLAVIK